MKNKSLWPFNTNFITKIESHNQGLEKENHTHNLYWFSPQENLHPIVLRLQSSPTKN